MVVFGQQLFYSVKKVVFGQKWFYSGKVDLLRLYGCIGANVDVFGQSGFISAK